MELGEGQDAPVGKVSRAQRRRDKKVAEELERLKRIRDEEAKGAGQQTERTTELALITNALRQRGLVLRTVRADGDCLYAAVADQLAQQGVVGPYSVAELRVTTADTLRTSPDDYAPFLTHPGTGEPLDAEQFEAYCTEVATTSAWGGQVELQALSSALRRPIHVLQAQEPALIVQGDEHAARAPPLLLTYHRHMYGLGEHYNSTKKLETQTQP